MPPTTNGNTLPADLESKLWATADKLRGHLDAAEYKNVVLGLIFLKYISDAFQERSFADLLEQTIHRYQNRTIDAAQVISDLIDLARELRDAGHRGETLGLNDDELAFYDALAENQSAVQVMGDKQLAVIALDLVKSVRANVTIDWTVKEGARAKMRILVKRILRKYGYPPDLQDAATTLVLEQAELLAAQWSN